MDNLFFSVKTGIKSIVGKDLITDDNIAVFELVKNSYDAHATKVIITFEEERITISDNGKGMSLNDIKEKWLALAYSAKKDGSEDKIIDSNFKRESYRDKIQERRFYAGAKGIGRFSSDRLGTSLRLITKTYEADQYEQLDINWEDFEKNDKDDFIKVTVPHKTLNYYPSAFPKNTTHGTIIEISHTKKWHRKDLRELKHSLEKLINPFSETNDFEIEIICEKELDLDKKRIDENGKQIIDRDRINGKINNSILDVIKLKTTEIKVNVTAEFIETELIDRGSQIYKIREQNKFNLFIDNMKVNLYYLNRGAKINFGKIMGIQPVNYGSIFLFKNGFRVQPYGDTGDDSWGLDFRAQQGHSRTLGTRDLFGRVDIISENTLQFKEVSSRDGGLVETIGYHQLMEIFKEKAHKRLERYVVGVLWGEAFLRKKYFKSDNEGLKFRENLVKDKDSDEFSIAKENIGSKIDFIQLLKGLADEKDIEILNYNKDLIDLVNENLEEVQPKFLKDLEKLADKINDEDLKKTFDLTQENFHQIQKEKEHAEQKATEEERKRKLAEQKAKEEEEKRKLAEQKAREEEEKRRVAELETLKKEKERAEAELNKIKAEQKAKEAEQKTENQKKQIDRLRSAETLTYKDLRDSNHIIGVYADDISKKIQLIKRKIDKKGSLDKAELLEFLQEIGLVNEKINTITKFTTKSGFLEARLSTKENIVEYIENYVKNIYGSLHKEMDYEFANDQNVFEKEFQPIELSVVLDNILNNSKKKGASKVIFNFEKENENLVLSIRDIGKTLDDSIAKELIFEEGITSTKGAGLGLSHVKRILEKDFNATIAYNPKYSKGFELLITFKK